MDPGEVICPLTCLFPGNGYGEGMSATTPARTSERPDGARFVDGSAAALAPQGFVPQRISVGGADGLARTARRASPP